MRDHLMEKLQPLWPHFQSQRSRAGEVTVGSAQARDKPEVDRVTRCKEHNWDCLRCCFCRQNRRRRWRENYSYLAKNKIDRKFWYFVFPPLTQTIFAPHILVFD